jgi:hypothetical protein
MGLLQVLDVMRRAIAATFQGVVGDIAGLSKASISLTVFRFSQALAIRVQEYIHLPSLDKFVCLFFTSVDIFDDISNICCYLQLYKSTLHRNRK